MTANSMLIIRGQGLAVHQHLPEVS